MADWGRKRDGRGMGFAFLNYSDSLVAGAAEVSVERCTGKVAVHNFWCALDCGIAVQPDNVAAQSESSIVYGLGLALMERITIKDGPVEQSNFYDYLIPRMSDVPLMHIEVISTDNPPIPKLSNIKLRRARCLTSSPGRRQMPNRCLMRSFKVPRACARPCSALSFCTTAIFCDLRRPIILRPKF